MRRCFTATIGPCLLLITVTQVAADDGSTEPLFIGEIESRSDDWYDLAGKGELLTIEGRVRQWSPFRIGLTGSKLPVISEGPKFLTIYQTDPHVLVTGRFRLRDGKPVFVAKLVEQVRAESIRFRERRTKVQRNDPDSWFELAQWADRRAEFYRDQDLSKLATAAKREGIMVMKGDLKSNDLTGFRDLARTARRKLGPTAPVDELLHEGYARYWKRNSQAVITDDLLFRMGKDFPGSLKPLDPELPELRSRYKKDPVETYREADDATRTKLHRILFTEMMRKSIESQLEDDFANGGRLADRIEKELPEFAELADVYRKKYLEGRVRMVILLSEEEMQELSDTLKKIGEDAQSRRVRERWLDHRLSLYSTEGPEGLFRAASLVRRYQNDTAEEVALLKRAARLNPNLDRVNRRMAELGYRRHQGQWLMEAEFQALPKGKIEQAVAEGRIIVGMTGQDVMKSQGKPTTRSRVGTTGDVTLVWVFGKRGDSRTVVYLQQRGLESDPVVRHVAVLDQ